MICSQLIGKDVGGGSDRPSLCTRRYVVGSVAVERLRLEVLRDVRVSSRPAYDPRSVSIGILHFGIGSFHRAHQALYTDDAIASGDDTWGICGVTQRSQAVQDLLAPQDYLYSVLERDRKSENLRVIGSVRDMICAPTEAERLTAAFANPSIRIVSLTVTEKGYRCDASGVLLVDRAIRHDLDGSPATTVVGRLVRGLDARRQVGAGPIAVMSCDNVPRNGLYLKGAVEQFVERLPATTARPLADWIAENVTFPSSVVDRIVPRISENELALVEEKIGFVDLGAVGTEPYRQWVIEGRFPGGRPRWPGVVDTADVEPYQEQKLRLLNATHSALAYLGAVAGFATIAEAIARPEYREFASLLMCDDAAPTLRQPDGVDLSAYTLTVLERFGNPYLTHRCDQVASDGSQKLPIRLLPSARIRIDSGAEPRWICLAVAAWMRFLGGTDDVGRPLRVADPMAAQLMRLASSTSIPSEIVGRLLGVGEIFPTELGENEAFRRLVTTWLGRLIDHGVGNTLSDLA